MMKLLIAVWLYVLHDQRGFAKVTGPLFSVGARGKFAQALVYTFWKGINVVREYVIPANPQTGAQGDRRTMLGGLGRSAKYVQTNGDFHIHALAVTPGGQSWISTYVRYIMTTYFEDAADFTTHDTEEGAHAAHVDFDDEASALGLVHFKVAYKDMAVQFTRSHQLYCMAKYGCDQYLLDNTKFNESPYSTAIADWNLAKIQEMVADFAV